jgi:WD40 repeat protein
VSFSRWGNEPRLFSVGTDSVARAFGLDGRPLATATFHGPLVFAEATRSGEVLVAGIEGVVWAWDARRGTTRELGRHGGRVWSLAVSDDGRVAASGGDDGSLRVYDLDSGRVQAIDGRGKRIRGLAVDASGARVLSASADGTIWLLDRPGRRLCTLGAGTGPNGLAFAGADNFVGATDDGTTRLWNVSEMNCLPFEGNAFVRWTHAQTEIDVHPSTHQRGRP